MINVQDALRDLPHFETFCSVQKLHDQVETLRSDPRFVVSLAGTSGKGVPIHLVRYGQGSVKALVLGSPHVHVSIGSLAVFGLLNRVRTIRRYCGSSVEWHIVPCIDPDGAILNEG